MIVSRRGKTAVSRYEDVRRISSTARGLSTVVVVLIAIGCGFAASLFIVAPELVRAPADAVTPGDFGKAVQAGVGALVYWVGAFGVALGLVAAIAALGLFTLRRLDECTSAVSAMQGGELPEFVRGSFYGHEKS